MIIRRTFSVCPICFKRIEASLVSREREVFLEKNCPEHGPFSTVVWRGRPEMGDWTGARPEMGADENQACPGGCGLCPDHQQGTCCLLLEVTARCNLSCTHCFAGSSAAAPRADPPLGRVKDWVADIAASGRAFLQLSGGEPTLRDDLPEIVAHAKKSGCEYVQLNSNALRLAEDGDFLKALAGAGLSFVFMQFDGLDDDIYRRLRGRALLATKLRAIENCGRLNIGVTLVPTVVPGVNSGDIGNILRLARSYSPVVRGVHFQPVSYFGRFPKAPDHGDRITLPELLAAIYAQAPDLVPPDSLAPSHCDHPRCGFHGAYLNTDEGLKPLTRPVPGDGCCGPAPAEKNRHFVGQRWQRPPLPAAGQPLIPMAFKSTQNEAGLLNSLDGFLHLARNHSFTISAMAFQDAYTLDLERLRQCSLHVYADGARVPFCAYYLNEAAKYRFHLPLKGI